MRTKVKKWGNSLAVRIPKSFAEETGLNNEAPVDISMDKGNLVITPVPQQEPTLEELLSQITKETLHGEIATGIAVGNEVW